MALAGIAGIGLLGLFFSVACILFARLMAVWPGSTLALILKLAANLSAVAGCCVFSLCLWTLCFGGTGDLILGGLFSLSILGAIHPAQARGRDR